MKIKPKVRAGLVSFNHSAVKIKSNIRSGALTSNRNASRI
jgi:hypothetical protein